MKNTTEFLERREQKLLLLASLKINEKIEKKTSNRNLSIKLENKDKDHDHHNIHIISNHSSKESTHSFNYNNHNNDTDSNESSIRTIDNDSNNDNHNNNKNNHNNNGIDDVTIVSGSPGKSLPQNFFTLPCLARVRSSKGLNLFKPNGTDADTGSQSVHTPKIRNNSTGSPLGSPKQILQVKTLKKRMIFFFIILQ